MFPRHNDTAMLREAQPGGRLSDMIFDPLMAVSQASKFEVWVMQLTYVRELDLQRPIAESHISTGSCRSSNCQLLALALYDQDGGWQSTTVLHGSY